MQTYGSCIPSFHNVWKYFSYLSTFDMTSFRRQLEFGCLSFGYVCFKKTIIIEIQYQ